MLTLWIYSKFTCLSNLEIHNAIYISDAFLISHGKKRYFGLSWMQHFGNAPLLQFLSPFENLSSSRFQNGKARIHFTFCSCLVGAVRREIYQPQVLQIAFMSKHFCALGLFQNNFFFYANSAGKGALLLERSSRNTSPTVLHSKIWVSQHARKCSRYFHAD